MEHKEAESNEMEIRMRSKAAERKRRKEADSRGVEEGGGLWFFFCWYAIKIIVNLNLCVAKKSWRMERNGIIKGSRGDYKVTHTH